MGRLKAALFFVWQVLTVGTSRSPAVRSSAFSFQQTRGRASLDWTAGGGWPHVIRILRR